VQAAGLPETNALGLQAIEDSTTAVTSEIETL
jgi:hypothetical protein